MQYLINLGLNLCSIHRVISFKQSPWVKSYIEFNTQKRKECKNNFEKSFYKALNNVIWGKSCQSRRKEKQIVIRPSDSVEKIIAKPNVKSWKIYNDELVAVELQPECVLLNTPIYTGLVTLDRSKHHLQTYHEMFKKYYGDNMNLLFVDTDSLSYQIKTKNIYEDLKIFRDVFDFSNYPKDHPLHDEKNKAVPGLLKMRLRVNQLRNL